LRGGDVRVKGPGPKIECPVFRIEGVAMRMWRFRV
jgi:hypothetical protein